LLPEEDAARQSRSRPRTLPPGDVLLSVERLVKEYPRKGGTTATLGKMFQPQAAGGERNCSRALTPSRSRSCAAKASAWSAEVRLRQVHHLDDGDALLDQTDGRIVFDGENIADIPAKSFARLPLRKRIQMVFQDPTDSLNPRFTAARAIADPILQLGDIRGRDALRTRCEELATQVGLPLELLDRFPHQLSGGQKARVGIARAIALHPDLIILDEPTGGAGRVGAGGGAEPAARSETAARHELPVRFA
jgi:peptide/nickel transport system ATP-binding protein